MPRFIDVHNGSAKGMTPEAAAHAHEMDLAVQNRFGVQYLMYWFDPVTGKVFCLSEAPNKEAVMQVHAASHGFIADEIFEVTEGR